MATQAEKRKQKQEALNKTLSDLAAKNAVAGDLDPLSAKSSDKAKPAKKKGVGAAAMFGGAGKKPIAPITQQVQKATQATFDENERLRTKLSEMESEEERRRHNGELLLELVPADVALSKLQGKFLQRMSGPKFQEFKESLKQHGQTTPIEVRLKPEGAEGPPYELVAGRRRITACRELGIKIKALVKPMDNRQFFTHMQVENEHRLGMSAIEDAYFFQAAIDDYGFTQVELGEMLGKPKNTVSRILSLTKIPLELVECLQNPTEMSQRQGLELLQAVKDLNAENAAKAIAPELARSTLDDSARLALMMDRKLAEEVMNFLPDSGLTLRERYLEVLERREAAKRNPAEEQPQAPSLTPAISTAPKTASASPAPAPKREYLFQGRAAIELNKDKRTFSFKKHVSDETFELFCEKFEDFIKELEAVETKASS